MDKQSNKKKKVKKAEVVAKCDQLPQVINHDLANINIESLIRIIRGQKVMFDSDLAMLYGVETRSLNQAVRRNLKRFPDVFMFQLTKEEWNVLRSQIVTLEDLKSQNVISKISDNQQEGVLISQIATSKPIERRGGRQKLPHVFTRNGIGMLSSVLRSETAVEVNIRIMRAFTAIPDIVNNNALMMQRILHIRVLSLLDKRAENVVATIHSRYYEPFQTDLKKHNEQYREILFVQLPHKNHDRFLIIDDDAYLLGASVKDMGVGMCAVTKMQVSPETILQLIK